MAIPTLYNLSQVAEFMHCSETYARSQLRARVWPGLKIAGRWHMTEQQVMEVIEAVSTTVVPPPPPLPSGLSRRSRIARQRT